MGAAHNNQQKAELLCEDVILNYKELQNKKVTGGKVNVLILRY